MTDLSPTDPAHDSALADTLAEALVDILAPHTVLHLDCGPGALVAALRARGVAAEGVVRGADAHAELAPHCRAGDIAADRPGDYDVVVWLPAAGERRISDAAATLGALADRAPAVVFAPPGLGGWTEAWAELFAAQRLYRDPDSDLGHIVPGLHLLRRMTDDDRAVLPAYSRRLAQLEAELAATRGLLTEQVAAGLAAIARSETLLATIATLRRGGAGSTTDLPPGELTDLLAAAEAEQARINSQAAALAEARDETTRLRSEVVGLRQWRESLVSTPGWRVLTALQGGRSRVAPPGSRRERVLAGGGAGLATVRGHGLVWTVARLLGRWWPAHTELRVSALPPPAGPAPPHQTLVDIVVCVHNALEDVRRCLASVVKHTPLPYTLVLIDDGSDPPTRDFLATFAAEHGSRLMRAELATGYTKAANRGLAAATAPLVLLLNSDTVVTPGWLDRLAAAILADPGLAVVGPLSNTASWQSIPEIEVAGDWAENPLPPGRTPADMAALVAADSERLRPDMPLLNGFCLLFRRSAVDQIGAFDEEAFPYGYGEEDDFMLRARRAGWRLALVDDCYVYHAQSRSYSPERRLALVPESQARIHARHGSQVMVDGVTYCRHDPVLQGLRARSRWWFEREAARHILTEQWSGRAIRFLAPPGGLSPAHPAVAVAGVLSECGARVEITESPAADAAGDGAVTIAVAGAMADALAPDHAIVWHPDGHLGRLAGPPVDGLRDRLLAVDTGPFRPRPTRGESTRRSLRIAAAVPVNGDTPAWRTTAEVLKMVAQPISLDVEVVWLDVHGLGPTAGALAGTRDVPWRWVSVPDAHSLAAALEEVDVVVDLGDPAGPSTVALAAMATGRAVLLADTPATSAYADPEEDCLAADPAAVDVCAHQLLRLVRDPTLVRRLGDAALLAVPRLHPERAAVTFTDVVALVDRASDGAGT